MPRIAAASRPCSSISRRTIGDVTAPPPLPEGAGGATGTGAGAVTGATGGGGVTTAGAGGAGAADGGAVAGAADGAGAPASVEITARRAPTGTVSPSGTTISVMNPPCGAGTSESTLSVDTSNSGSSASIFSPTCLNHFVIVPSVTVSPSCGIVTSMSPSGSSYVWDESPHVQGPNRVGNAR